MCYIFSIHIIRYIPSLWSSLWNAWTARNGDTDGDSSVVLSLHKSARDWLPYFSVFCTPQMYIKNVRRVQDTEEKKQCSNQWKTWKQRFTPITWSLKLYMKKYVSARRIQMTWRFSKMPEFALQKDLKRAHFLESSGSKMYIEFRQRVQESVGYKIPRNTVVLDHKCY